MSAQQHLQEGARRLGYIAAQISLYGAAPGPCPCGARRGHVGWVTCALNHPLDAPEESER